jgi:mono/diheme cytochrome c family protein
MPLRILVALCALAIGPGIGVASAQEKPKIKTAPIERVAPSDGAQMYQSYCAPCHGKEGRGDGPAAAALKKAPADLTTLNARNGGTFPTVRVSRFIEGADETAAHGSREMPIWGRLFRDLGPDPGIAQLRVSALSDYLKSIQR